MASTSPDTTAPKRGRDTYLTMAVKALVAQQRGPTQRISRQAIESYIVDNMLEGKAVHAPSLRKALHAAESSGMVERTLQSYRVTPSGRDVAKKGTSGRGRSTARKTTGRKRRLTSAGSTSGTDGIASVAKKPTVKRRKATSTSSKRNTTKTGATNKSTTKKNTTKKVKKPLATRRIGAAAKKNGVVRRKRTVAVPCLTFAGQMQATQHMYLLQSEQRGEACRKCMEAFFVQYPTVSHLVYDHTVGQFHYGGSPRTPFLGDCNGLDRDKSSNENASASSSSGVGVDAKKTEEQKPTLCQQMDAELLEFTRTHGAALGELFGAHTTWTMIPKNVPGGQGGQGGGKGARPGILMVVGNHMPKDCGSAVCDRGSSICGQDATVLCPVAASTDCATAGSVCATGACCDSNGCCLVPSSTLDGTVVPGAEQPLCNNNQMADGGNQSSGASGTCVRSEDGIAI